MLAAMLSALPVLGAPLGHAESPGADLGGCREGGVMTGRFIPSSGSVGQNIRREVTLRGCDSPLLPGIVAGQFTADIPFNTGGPSTARVAWSDGSVSTATGYGNGLWLITGGPASGHGIQIQVANTWNGWYQGWTDVTVTSAKLLP
ncbi:hypothetical protein GCM10027089_50490 [Nocardia thraciensis]